MTVTAQNVVSGPYYPNGVTVTFPFSFQAASSSEVAVEIDGLVIASNLYVVSMNPDGTGSITMLTPPAAGTLFVYSSPLFTQNVNFENQGPYYQSSLNAPLDRAAIRDLWLRDQMDRSVRAPIGKTGLLLSGTANKIVATDGSGNLVELDKNNFKGDPGGNVLSVGLATEIVGISVPVGTNLIQTSGYDATGTGAALYVDDALSDAAMAAAYPLTCKVTANGRYFRLLPEGDIIPEYFGVSAADLAGGSNVTTKMKAFFDYCIVNGRTGFIPKGIYISTPGQYFFDNGGVDKAFPEFKTAGTGNVEFKFDPVSAVDEPMFVITNGRAGSANPGGNWAGGDGKYWSGGGFHGMTITDTAAAGTKTKRHGFELQGWVPVDVFGYLLFKGNNNGSAIYLPKAMFDGAYAFNSVGATNPDPCAVGPIKPYVEAQYAKFTIENRNGVGMDGWDVQYARGIGNYSGGILGIGQGTYFRAGSFGSCAGAVLDDNTADGVFTANRLSVENFEIDDCQYGFILNRTSQFTIRATRFNHRYNSSFTTLNPGEGFWPRKCIQLACGTGPSTISGHFIDIIHRIQPLEAGVNPAGKGGGPVYDVNALGTLIFTTVPGGISNVDYDHQYIDSAALGAVASSWHSGFTQSSRVLFKEKGIPFFASNYGTVAMARYTGGAPTIANGGFGGAGSILAYNSAFVDKQAAWNTAGYYWTAPWTGHAKVSACVETTVADGTRIQLGIMTQPAAGGAYTLVATRNCWKKGAATETFSLDSTIISVVAGDKVFVSASNNSGAAIALTPTISSAASCNATFEMLGR